MTIMTNETTSLDEAFNPDAQGYDWTADEFDWLEAVPEQEGYLFRMDGLATWYEYKAEPSIFISTSAYRLYRKTPKGGWYLPFIYWMKHAERWACTKEVLEREKRFILDSGRKRFAYPTKAMAFESFKIRTSKRVQHCKNSLDIALAIQRKIEEEDK